MMKAKTIFRLAICVMHVALIVTVWSLRLLIELLALCHEGSQPRASKNAYSRRHSWERDGYSWEGRTDEMK